MFIIYVRLNFLEKIIRDNKISVRLILYEIVWVIVCIVLRREYLDFEV